MKKLLSFTFAVLLTVLTIGCTANTQTANNTEIETPKGTYNIAYVTIPFLTTEIKINDSWSKENNPNYVQEVEKLKNPSGSFNYGSASFFCNITDWEYGKNDTIILYLTDGRTLQTSTNNVLLMYDPDLK